MHIHFETDAFLKLVNEMEIEDMQRIYDIRNSVKKQCFSLTTVGDRVSLEITYNLVNDTSTVKAQ